ncbi:MAG: GNAT family N-acetyltransferase [Rhizobiaceae bacterium]|nr:GNAT family N-acetyltransferase [Rhizobiaceae bacterium]
MTITVQRIARENYSALFDALAQLRITVFRDFPYLYDGDLDYERNYLGTFLASPGAVVIGAFDGGRLVGAATGSPLVEHHDEFSAPFIERGMPVEKVFYFGESVLEASYRGQGVGVRFFEERERAAREDGFGEAVFSAVMRPGNHPLQPSDYRPLDRFWENRGYRRIEGMVTEFAWKDIGESHETVKPMEYWYKILN